MGKIIITYNEVSKVNHILEDKGLCYKLHLHDACGSQSFTIEASGNRTGEGGYEDMVNVITEYFNSMNIRIKFFEKGLGFMIIQ